MEKLKLNRQDGKKGSVKVLKWTEKEKESFGELKRLLARELEVYHLDPDKPRGGQK